MKKLFEVTYGYHLDMKNYVMAKSFDEVLYQLFEMKWLVCSYIVELPICSHIVELPIMTFEELEAAMPELRKKVGLERRPAVCRD
jgi:hypothetical protein